ncbi:double-strand break repair protein AddB [Tropicibacter naphthalenivorans]|uniref:Double-strand break repair protein AddB n=1 Tax=Tropicibacter naphthalenivorans TaxID=441103 RepID=A0A0N7M057_9RHOB|nr:double-strand break repair protein AddB [Tropicibacter naphthalenivorans]CUH79537.1 double-strand break repair protein AddB [Tropicibacter naphthalenivorans]SMC73384.1 double-strand break repair protein AddB [Tropicibacter naphthalenivorans]
MFDTPGPRVFGLAPGVDFPKALVQGLRARVQGPPEAIARVELYVNTTRMARRLREIFDAGPASLLPQVRLITDLTDPFTRAQLPAKVPPLRRRLELTGLVSRLLEAQPDLAPRSSLFDLSDSLATLMEEMQSEGVSPETVSDLDITDQSGHWQRALSFFNIVQHYFSGDEAPDPNAYTRMAMELRLKAWAENPPQHPILVAGSTGSRGTSHEFMKAVSQLPQGAVILPGFDPDMPDNVWDQLTNALTGEDHPQFRFARLMQDLDLRPAEVRPWTDAKPPNPARNQLFSLALRPAPVTHQWLSEGPSLPDLPEATADLTLIEAPSQREEALAIALRLRQAAQDGTRAALITPDRMLTRQVTAALDRWNILPDDSAGTPAQLSPPGRLLRHVAALFDQPLTAEALLTLLKHPLTHMGADRNAHNINTRDLELHIRRKGMPYPAADLLRAWGAANKRETWADWVATQFCDQETEGKRPLPHWLDRHIALAEAITAGSTSDDPKELWNREAGRAVQKIVSNLREEAGFGTDMSARDYADLFGAILSQGEVRNPDTPHPHILIWGTMEARVMGADLLILAGLNEGSWPEMPGADPWLNRKMRFDAGLLLPERRIGLSAHDFQQAAAAPEVWLTRSVKSDDAETVPSRWINRMMNLMRGLPDRHGPEALKAMQQRGQRWLSYVDAAETPIKAEPEPRPSPAPPTEARPHSLSVTEIKRLVRDPYAIYAKHVLRLRPLDPLMQAPDALMRGILLHSVLEEFVKETVSDQAQLTPEAFIAKAREIIDNPDNVPFPTSRALWLSRMQRIAQWFTDTEAQRQSAAYPAKFEVRGEAQIPSLGFTLRGTADRIDIDQRGGAHIYDYKTGDAPTKKQQETFDKQLLLEAAMVTRGAFKDIDPRHVERALFIALNPRNPQEVSAPLEETPPDAVWEEFVLLITRYMQAERGYTARRALMTDNAAADYDHLSRFGEWDVTDLPQREDLK